MSILFVFILNIIYVSYVRSDGLPCVMCAYAGNTVYKDIPNNFKFNVADVPQSCEVIIYGEHYMNGQPDSKDAPALQSLVSAGKNVYMLYKCPENAGWEKIVKDPAQLDKFIAPMISYLNENKIKGVILGYLGILNGFIPDYATYMNNLILRVKECVPSIKVGIYLQGSDAPNISDTKNFDFTKIDANVDFYDVDLWTAGDTCHENSMATGGRLPKTSPDKTIVSMEVLLNDISHSKLDQSKLVMGLFDIVSTTDSKAYIKTYSDLCKGGDHGSITWCGENIKVLYDEVVYLKTVFKGLLINYLDYDDADNTCGCGKYPVANTFIDALKGNAMKDCPKIC